MTLEAEKGLFLLKMVLPKIVIMTAMKKYTANIGIDVEVNKRDTFWGALTLYSAVNFEADDEKPKSQRISKRAKNANK